MAWYDSLIIIGIVAGFLLAFFGSYHGRRGKLKTGVLGWIIIFLSLIVKALIWLINIT